MSNNVRIFKSNDDNGDEQIYVIPIDKIEKKHNCYGCYKKTETYSETDIEEIGKHFKIEFNVYSSTENILKEIFPKYGENGILVLDSIENAKKVIEIINFKYLCEDDSYQNESDDIFTYEGNGIFEKFDATNGDSYEYETYHDGRNFVEIVLSGVDTCSKFEEITDEIGNDFEENLIHIHSSGDKHGYSYSIHINKETKKLYRYSESRWQGSYRDFYVELCAYDAEIAKAEHFTQEQLIEYFPEFIEKYGNHLFVAYEQSYQENPEYDIISHHDILYICETFGGGSDTRGVKLYKHVNGKYYKYHWTRWQGEKASWLICSEEDALEFIEING